jgi:hypothetical protein
MCTIITPPFPDQGKNQYADFDAAQCMPGQCGDLETPGTGKSRPRGLERSGRYAIVGRAGADFISFETQTFLVEKATNG